VRIGLSRFQATSFGRVVPEFGPVPVEQIQAIGIMLADKQPGPFELEVASIEVETSPAV
jgi:monofunctional biosynthetic peptidoglycan transglycosylase